MLRNMRISMRSDDSFREDANDTYRTCPECGVDCPPEDAGADGLGIRWVFSCPTHGPHNMLDPFPTSGAEIEQVIKLGLSYAFGPVCS